MTKLNFIYIGKDFDGNKKENLPSGDITCIKMKCHGDKLHYVPIVSYGKPIDEVNEFFVYGIGWIKLKDRKKYTIPAFDGTTENFEKYLEEYGDDVMCYCINGDIFYSSPDCCTHSYKNEYNAIKCFGAEKYNDFSTHFNNMIEEQKKWFNTHHLPLFLEHGYGNVVKQYLFEAELNLGYSFIPIPILSLNVIHDDTICENLYRKLRYWELEKKTPLTYEEIDNKIKDEIESDNSIFPQCIDDRIKLLFGDEASKEYNYIMDKFVSADAENNN